MGTVQAKEPSTFSHGERDNEGNVKVQKTINLQNVEARIDKVNIEGLERTKDDIVRSTVKELFTVDNFEEVIKQSHKVKGKLEDLGCFRSISIHIDTSSGPNATPNGYEVTYFVRELKRVKGGINTMFGGDNEGSMVVSCQWPNLFGRGERVNAEYTYGSKNTKTFNFGFYKPFFLSIPDTSLSASIFQNDVEWTNSGYKLLDRGALLDLTFYSFNKLKHNVQWEGSWRELSAANRFTSFFVRSDCGHSLKSSLRHILSLDLRDSPIFPTYGGLMQFITEFAGLGGNVGFLKNEVLLQKNVEVFPETVVQAAFTAGWMSPSADIKKKIYVCDRFFLGGPLTLRGFQNRGLEPSSDKNYIGGLMYWAGGLHLYSPLPFRPGAGGLGDYVRTHIFVNAGNLGNFVIGKGNWVEDIMNSTRMAYGAGIAIRLGQMARVELNYVIPVYFQESDSLNKGVQIGVGVHFL